MQLHEKLSQFELKLGMLVQSSVNLTSDDLMQQYRAIRHICGLSKNETDLLNWIHDEHYDTMGTIIENLSLRTSEDNDSAIINEAKLALELFEPYIIKQDHSNMKCDVFGNDILTHDCHCGASEGHVRKDDESSCPHCSTAVSPTWKVCPQCGEKLDHNCCIRCGAKLESSWKLCPFCGAQTN